MNRNIKAISDATWQMINTELLVYAKQENIEKGRKVRIDCTCIETNIHHPTDASLLWDAVRLLTRLIERCWESGIRVAGFHNHTRVAKRRMLAIVNAKRKKQRKSAYADLLKVANKVVGYARRTIESVNSCQASELHAILFCSCF